MSWKLAAGWLAGGLVLAGGSAAARPPRVVSLDQCADQYVLALSPAARIGAVSPRAKAADSYFRQAVGALPVHRASTEAILASAPDVVLRSWGGSHGLEGALKRRGIRLVQLGDPEDLPAAARELQRIATVLDARPTGDRLAAETHARLERAQGAWGGRRGLYLTPSAFTTGPGTFVDAMLRAAGLTNDVARAGYGPVPLERLVLDPPAAVVLGFFESVAAWRWSPGRHPVLQRLVRRKAIGSLPGSVLACPGWFAAEGVSMLAAASSRAKP